jgi:hypothetical protein
MTLRPVSMTDCIVDEIALCGPSAVQCQLSPTAQYPDAFFWPVKTTLCQGHQTDIHVRCNHVSERKSNRRRLFSSVGRDPLPSSACRRLHRDSFSASPYDVDNMGWRTVWNVRTRAKPRCGAQCSENNRLILAATRLASPSW